MYRFFFHQYGETKQSIICLPMNLLQWMGAIRVRIPNDSVNQLNIVKQKAFMFVITNMQLFTLQYVINWWNGVMDCLWIIVMFLSALWTNLDGTHSLPLVNTWCNAKFLQICFEEETNSSTSWMAWGWAHFMNYSFKWIFYGPWENQSFCFVFTLTNYVHFIHIHED